MNRIATMGFSLVLVFTVWLSDSHAQRRFPKPVSSAPDYNGTYQGSPGTGSARYTTLYRDNQDNGSRSGCRGEGCGKHPGVDIAVSSGTAVYLPIDGQVVTSRCDSSWGGLIVVRSPNPERAYEWIYQTFAHLKVRQYSNGVAVEPGHYIGGGTEIGKSGGNRKYDQCSGNSSGSHLHFQVDKDDGNLEPWFPNSSSLHYPDASFSVMENTYNPMVLLQGGYKWQFNQSGNRELWDLFNWQNWGVSSGSLWLDGSYDPYIRRGGLTNCGLNKPCSSAISAESRDYQYLSLDMYNQCSSGYGKIYFTTNRENYWDENKTVYYNSPYYSSSLVKLYMAWHPKWSGVITGLRFDPAEHCSPSVWDPNYFGEISLSRW